MLQFPSPHEKILPDDIKVVWPSVEPQDTVTLDRIAGSLVGLAVGDALGASVEFRPRQYLVEHPVKDMMSGGTWGLREGQWTDDTSMALCLASSLITQKRFNPYDQMVRYKWWYRHGYLSSTGKCFDIGNATRNSIEEFSRRQKELKSILNLRTDDETDQLPFHIIEQVQFDCNCSGDGVAGNGALMRLAPVPLFFYRTPDLAVELSGRSARLTHGDDVAFDACRYYGALIVAAVRGEPKESLLSSKFYNDHRQWFGSQALDKSVLRIATGSYKEKKGYKGGIRGKGHITVALEAALWAFWSSNSYAEGALNAVNLGDDTDTTAAIYGQLAGAYYGYKDIPGKWKQLLCAHSLIVCIAEWLNYLGPSGNTPLQPGRASRSSSVSRFQLQQPVHMNVMQPRQQNLVPIGKSKQNHHNNRSSSAPRRPQSRISELFCGLRSNED